MGSSGDLHPDRDNPHGRFRYGPWRGGSDPLAPPYDVRSALDELGRDVLAGGTTREALRDVLRRGLDRHRGLDEIADRIRRMREAARRRGNLGGTLDEIRKLLDEALDLERAALAQEDTDEARLGELDLATLPDDTAGAVRALAEHQWHSPEAAQTYDRIARLLRRELLDAQFEGLKAALSGQDPEAMQRVKDMLADLNSLLAAHARGEDTTDQFRDFMDKHGDLFPDDPRNVDELIDSLARRQAAAARMLASLNAQQRQQLSQLMSDALADADIASEMAQLADNLRALRPGLDRGTPVNLHGDEPLGYGAAVEAVSEIADLEALTEQLSQGYRGASLDDVDVERLERHLGADAARDFEALRRLERELERQGYLTHGDEGLRLTPRAVRRLGETALRRVFEGLATARGDHDDRRSGQADEPTGSTRQWAFGDELPLDTVRTVSNAVLRTRGGSEADRRAPSRLTAMPANDTAPNATAASGVALLHSPLHLSVEDFAVVETERRTSAAVALCVDMSFSMFHEGRWGPMKQTALALSHLVQTRFRQDALEIIGFTIAARRLTPVQLADAEPEWVQGTNLEHALMLASRHLRRHPEAEPLVLVVTDGEPTAHLDARGVPTFAWPTVPATVRATMAQVDLLRRAGATLNVFMLGDDPGLARFVDAVARRAAGRVFTPSVDRLGEYVVADYLRSRRGRH
ncbi:MAG: hypothetical protein L0H79_09700 [Intrasporangium sp.]|uniref:hypothetical protein n=1 Tax=Intrasporangium sp. TaxID=1925024 RepID=UPI002648FD16|nr:hypothetical protein [Intrasporangium sp.]MDN5796008.1 hypothetical protein [Intrasporangium sp.]